MENLFQWVNFAQIRLGYLLSQMYLWKLTCRVICRWTMKLNLTQKVMLKIRSQHRFCDIWWWMHQYSKIQWIIFQNPHQSSFYKQWASNLLSLLLEAHLGWLNHLKPTGWYCYHFRLSGQRKTLPRQRIRWFSWNSSLPAYRDNLSTYLQYPWYHWVFE